MESFDNPSFLFVLEDGLKNLIGEKLFYRPYFREFYTIAGGERILDFGCGGGISSRCLARLVGDNGSVVCVDASDYWIRKAAGRLRKFNTVQCLSGDIRTMQFAPHSFDIISVLYVIHDIPEPERATIIQRLAELLNECGSLYIREPFKESHGMPVAEMQSLCKAAGLIEKKQQVKGTEYSACYGHSA